VIILGLLAFWAVVLVALFWRNIVGGREAKSVDRFNREHRVLRDHGYSVAPARTLEDEAPLMQPVAPIAPRRANLRLVRDTDTRASLAADVSWEDFNRSLGIEDAPAAPVRPANRYAAYKATPSVTMSAHREEPLKRTLTMKQRRTRIFSGLVGSALFFTAVNVLAGISFLQDVALVAWVGVVGYVVLALVAISQGYLNQPAFMTRRTSVATVTPLPATRDEFVDEFYDESSAGQWEREPVKRAFG